MQDYCLTRGQENLTLFRLANQQRRARARKIKIMALTALILLVAGLAVSAVVWIT
ncbi:hypothetical protein [Polymorphum gilvum]|uniref:hypothetical protein n=1 Tax=Polymorphum gilvum TaxID=991904 RepID=UPI0002D410B9|nr:hypothetical protein [Polymorphum gilvum]